MPKRRPKKNDVKMPNVVRLLKGLRDRPDHNERLACAYGAHYFAGHGRYKVCQREHCGAVYALPDTAAGPVAARRRPGKTLALVRRLKLWFNSRWPYHRRCLHGWCLRAMGSDHRCWKHWSVW